MGGKNRDRRCKVCGESLPGVWMNYCVRCRSSRIRENNAVKKALNPEAPNLCVDCGVKLWGKYAQRCKECAKQELRRRREIERRVTCWDNAPPPSGLPICQE